MRDVSLSLSQLVQLQVLGNEIGTYIRRSPEPNGCPQAILGLRVSQRCNQPMHLAPPGPSPSDRPEDGKQRERV